MDVEDDLPQHNGDEIFKMRAGEHLRPADRFQTNIDLTEVRAQREKGGTSSAEDSARSASSAASRASRARIASTRTSWRCLRSAAKSQSRTKFVASPTPTGCAATEETVATPLSTSTTLAALKPAPTSTTRIWALSGEGVAKMYARAARDVAETTRTDENPAWRAASRMDWRWTVEKQADESIYIRGWGGGGTRDGDDGLADRGVEGGLGSATDSREEVGEDFLGVVDGRVAIKLKANVAKVARTKFETSMARRVRAAVVDSAEESAADDVCKLATDKAEGVVDNALAVGVLGQLGGSNVLYAVEENGGSGNFDEVAVELEEIQAGVVENGSADGRSAQIDSKADG
jgi:hypothetical protein